jgi:glycosyltransferase involved in cell wall biosynthesis
MSHPTQYHAPWFQELARQPELELEVLYCFQPNAIQQGAGFGVPFQWDIALLDAYNYRFLENVAKRPGFNFRGCDTPDIGRVIDEAGYDVFLINGWNVQSYWQAMRACWDRELPTMIRGDSHLRKTRSVATRLFKQATIGRWLPRFDAILTVGILNEDFYEHYGADRSRFFPVRHFVDNDWFAARATEAANRLPELRQRWNISEDAFVVLFAGKFVDLKRPMDALIAVERANHPYLHLLMVGDGPLRDRCEQYARQRDIRVSFAGFLNQQQMPEAYAIADLLVLPSATETWGLVVNEAMACGVPALVANGVGCAPDLIAFGETGGTFEVGNISALASLLREYATDSARATEEGIRAMARVAPYNRMSAARHTVHACTFATTRAAHSEGVHPWGN